VVKNGKTTDPVDSSVRRFGGGNVFEDSEKLFFARRFWRGCGEGMTHRVHDPIMFDNVFESIDSDEYVVAMFYAEHRWPLVDYFGMVEFVGFEGSTGTWVPVPGETAELKEVHTAKLLGYYPVPSEDPMLRKAVLAFGFPTAQWKDPNIPMLLTAINGNIGEVVKLVDVWLPKSWLKAFRGPKFGTEGVRKLLDVKDRPLTLAMLKPKIGLTPKESAKQCYEAALGGIDIIKDDEMTGDLPRCRMEERLTEVMEALDKANSKTGEKTLYTVNVTDEAYRIPEKAEKAVELGANALMVNFTAGWSAMRALAENPKIKVPILFHPDGAAAFGQGRSAGTTEWVFAKLTRISGADFTIIPTPWGKFSFPGAEVTPEPSYRMAQIYQAPFLHFKKTWVLPGGGMYPGLVPVTVGEFGRDVIIGGGGAVAGHPMGATAGAKALRQAVDATMENIPLEEYAKNKPELRSAIEAWGVFKAPKEAMFKGAKTS
jgi:2,3-diketo-5-methylthiopentyl-1-phosphate enolase